MKKEFNVEIPLSDYRSEKSGLLYTKKKVKNIPVKNNLCIIPGRVPIQVGKVKILKKKLSMDKLSLQVEVKTSFDLAENLELKIGYMLDKDKIRDTYFYFIDKEIEDMLEICIERNYTLSQDGVEINNSRLKLGQIVKGL